MKVAIQPSVASGCVSAPPSKSMAHRLLICAGLSEGESCITGLAPSQDVLATVDCLRALGAHVRLEGDTATVQGADPRRAPSSILPCRESGSTLRFFLPLCLLGGAEQRLIGAPRLLERPQTVYRDLCAAQDIAFAQNEKGITVKGILKGGQICVDGSVSSQFISGLLFALPLLSADSEIVIMPAPESRPYLELTRSALRDSGIAVDWKNENTLTVRGNQAYAPIQCAVEGDYSNAAFLEALNLMGGHVEVRGLRADSMQGDAVFRDAFERLVRGDGREINLRDCPDLAPILFAMAAAHEGGTFVGTKRLRWKECDRGAAMREELAAMGGELIEEEDRITVLKRPLHAPSRVLSGHNDHRIVMALSVLLTRFGGEIAGAEAVTKSMPDFFERLASLGISCMLDQPIGG